MSDLQTSKALAEFVAAYSDFHIESTGASVVDFTDNLYNVKGSTDDPKIDGKKWKPLLISKGIDSDCYVTNGDAPDSSSHPSFNVGGHMTTDSKGDVEKGGICYLMPLCHWHNNPARDGVAFKHTKKSMIKLTGYMEKDVAETFAARLPSDESFSMVFESGDIWQTGNLAAPPKAGQETYLAEGAQLSGTPDQFVLFKREMLEGRVVYRIVEAQLAV